jgi:rhamnulokinase
VPTTGPGAPMWAYLSSGTWSLLGVEVPNAVLHPESRAQSHQRRRTRRHLSLAQKHHGPSGSCSNAKRSFEGARQILRLAALVHLAEASPPFASLINPDDARFSARRHARGDPGILPRHTQPVPGLPKARSVRCCSRVSH